MTESPKTHNYYMVVAQIMYVAPNEQDVPTMGSLPVNCVIWTDEPGIKVVGLQRAQQLALAAFQQKMPNPDAVNIADIVIVNLIPLGCFTEEDFNRPPEGFVVQEKTSDDLAEVLGNA